MNIRVVDIERLNRKLVEELAKGKIWALYDPGLVYTDIDKIHFFLTNKDVFIYQMKNASATINCLLISIEPLHKTLEQVLKNDVDRSILDYYYIGDKYFEVSRATIPNENQDAPSQTIEAIRENFDQIRKQLGDQGFDHSFLPLEASMKKGTAKHEERSYEHFGSEMVMCNHLFTKNSDGHYSPDTITGTLYFNMDVDHATIKDINTQDLDDQMLELNWNFDGYSFLNENEPLFQRLCEDPIGQVIAVQLFNNHATPSWYDKPDFLSRVEDELRIYPKLNFPGDTKADTVYQSLKTYQEITIAVLQHSIPEAQDANNKTALIEKLVKGEPCSLVAPPGPRQGDEVMLSWNSVSKMLSFVFKDEPQLNARQYFAKQSSAQFDQTVKDLEQYPFRQLNNPIKKYLLVEALLEGNKKPVHLEKAIIPAEHIEKYIVIELPQPGSEGHIFKPIELFSNTNLDTAKKEMRNIGEHFINDESKTDSSLIVVGKYKGKDLEFDGEGIPSVNSGFVAALENKIFFDWMNLDASHVLVEQIFVERDKESNKLVFSNKHGEAIEIDNDFWTPKERASLDKKQSSVDVDLMPKNRVNGDKGKGKTL